MAADRQITPRRLLMTADAVGGVWQYSLDLLSGIAGKNVEVLLASLGPRPSEAQRNQLAEITNVRLETGDFALEWMENPWSDIASAGDWLMKLAADFKPDLIHLNGYCHASLQWNAPRIVVAHSCVCSWWRAVHNAVPDAEWSEYRRRVKEGLLACDAIVAPSRYMAAAISAEYDIAIEQIRIIHNGSAARFLKNRRANPVILAAGRLWDKAKNIHVLTEAASDVTWPIQIAGENHFSRNASVSGLENVEWLGRLSHEELLQRMAGAAIFAHTALYEPFGLSVLEAARAGCALVLSDIPSMRELWENAALFVDPRDHGAWSGALNALISHCSFREQLACLARRRALSYSPEQCSGSYVALYEKVMHAKRGDVRKAVA